MKWAMRRTLMKMSFMYNRSPLLRGLLPLLPPAPSSNLRSPRPKGLWMLTSPLTPEIEVENRRSGKQPKVDDNTPQKKLLKEQAHQAIARWIYDAGIPLNVVNMESFEPMIEAIGQYGPGLTPPTYYQVCVPLLKKEVENVNKQMEDHKKEREENGCTLMCDGWTDRKNRSLINFLVNCPKGSMFIESVDASSRSTTGDSMYRLLDEYVERIGEANVVQIVTDSAAYNKMAGKLLMAKRPHLYWTPCAAHCLDLMLEDIFKLPYLKRTWERAIKVHGYIYNRPTLLNMVRHFTQRKELIKPAKTHFATACLTLQRVHQQKNNLRKMFTSEAWSKSKWAKEADGKKVAEIMLSPSFWNNVLLALRFACPLVKVLRLVDGEEKPAMGYIYEAMDRAKETIINTFGGDEDKYKTVFEIIDVRWEVQLHQPLHAAGYYLNPAFF
ncbi:uncharacterized protein LOC131304373 [Rhododendron vialii]|uniref:uncharacterized protein LOC131304373 n=1 Tax=Rhododendron vialii TaxID=182163 RepID=UPI00265DAF49|nr:uncharacterized protein LOC131304373 [Rhododendron vialii]XP_058187580.1 uncharacterized protein LOC131304373 [Rhododendron vialii]XP_058187581.1 uncharacterized protein LOC131304373 [Rhododendron vialii]